MPKIILLINAISDTFRYEKLTLWGEAKFQNYIFNPKAFGGSLRSHKYYFKHAIFMVHHLFFLHSYASGLRKQTYHNYVIPKFL